MQTDYDVIILGAGAAGIGAACYLIASGIKPILLEAKHIYGGRVAEGKLTKNLLTVDYKEASTLTIQKGANWIHGMSDHNPFYVVAKKFDFSLHQTSSDDEPGDDVLLFDNDESRGHCSELSKAELDKYLSRYDWIKENFETVAHDVTGKRSDDILSVFNKTIQLSEVAVEESSKQLLFGPCSDREIRCLNWFFDRIAIDLCAPLQDMPSSYYIDGESDGLHGEALVIGGYFNLLKHIVDREKLDIIYGTIVKRISSVQIEKNSRNEDGIALVKRNRIDDSNSLTIECEGGSVYRCKKCLVTLPIGVIQSGSVKFAPEVPKCISTLTKSFRSGLLNLVWLWYPHRFWSSKEDSDTKESLSREGGQNEISFSQRYNIFGVTRSSAEDAMFSTFLVLPTYDEFGRPQAVLMCQLYGPFAEAVEDMTEREVADKATAVLRSMFGPDVPNAWGCLRTTWLRDPYAKGSYVYAHKDDEVDEAADDVHEEEPNALHTKAVFYAGEALSEQHRGTVHGAYFEGQKAAKELLASLSGSVKLL